MKNNLFLIFLLFIYRFLKINYFYKNFFFKKKEKKKRLERMKVLFTNLGLCHPF